jgi:hypothetical protein
MIKYRYTNLDPEPPAHVTRIATGEWRRGGRWSPDFKASGPQIWYWSDRWRRVPCAGMGHGTVMTNGDRRKDEREYVRGGWGPMPRRTRRSYHRGLRVHRLCHPNEAGKYPDHPNWDGHYHWWNDDKMRNWSSLRGAIKRFDLDAYRRLHTTYRRGWKKRK